jgi:hypothetical protein
MMKAPLDAITTFLGHLSVTFVRSARGHLQVEMVEDARDTMESLLVTNDT